MYIHTERFTCTHKRHIHTHLLLQIHTHTSYYKTHTYTHTLHNEYIRTWHFTFVFVRKFASTNAEFWPQQQTERFSECMFGMHVCMCLCAYIQHPNSVPKNKLSKTLCLLCVLYVHLQFMYDLCIYNMYVHIQTRILGYYAYTHIIYIYIYIYIYTYIYIWLCTKHM